MTLFDTVLRRAKERVVNANDTELNSEDYREKLYNNLKIVAPYLDRDKAKNGVEEIRLDMNSAPPGIMFTSGQLADVVWYEVPIVGHENIFIESTTGFPWSKFVLYDNHRVHVREVSVTRIEGNKQVMSEIKERVVNVLNAIQSRCDNFQVRADQFNSERLQPFIRASIEEERKKRRSHDEAVDFLKL